MKLSKTIMAATLVSAFVFTGAYAQHGGWHGSRNMADAGFDNRPSCGLNLTDAQRLQIIELKKEFFKSNEAEWNARRDAMTALLNADNFDEAAARKLIETKEVNRNANMLNHMKFKHAVNKILTPEQRKLQKEFMKDKGPGMKYHKMKGSHGHMNQWRDSGNMNMEGCPRM